MILYEDNHLLIVSKRAGDLVQGDHTGDATIVDSYKEYIKEKYNKPGKVFLHPVHRLDRPVSGCLILGKTSKALSRMTVAFRDAKVAKTYLALCHRPPARASDRLVDYMLKDQKRNVSRIVSSDKKGAKKAILKYKLLARSKDLYLLEISPETGRSHQIRVQLAHMGCPILGDNKYKGRRIVTLGMIYLHCAQLSFIHPTTKEGIEVKSPPLKGLEWDHFNADELIGIYSS